MSQQSSNFTNAGGTLETQKYYAALSTCLVARARRVLHGRPADALDMAQEVLEKFVVQFRGRPLPPEPVAKAWSFRTLDRLVINDWRRREVRRRALADPAVSLRVVSDPVDVNSDRVAAAERVCVELRDAVRLLSPKLREVFVLHQGGLCRRRIAARLQIRPGAVSKRLHDARARLREVVATRVLLRGAHFAVRSRPRHDGPGPAAASRS